MKGHKAFTVVRNLAAGVMAAMFVLALIPTHALAKSYDYYTVRVEKGYLALRTAPAYREENEIGELYTGDTVRAIDTTSDNGYWWVYSSKYGRSGWVNKNYLVYKSSSYDSGCRGYEGGGTSTKYYGSSYRVHVNSGFLALRTAPAYDDSNIIGELYTGDYVTYISTYNSDYWWVYSSKLGREGYVNCNYLDR